MSDKTRVRRGIAEAVAASVMPSVANADPLNGGDPRRLLAAIVESSEDAILSKTLDGTITSWNAGAERMYGYLASEAVGRPVSFLVPPEREDDTVLLLARLRRGERIRHYETVRMARDGRRIAVSLTISPLRDHGGRVVGASAIARDITDRAGEAMRWRILSEVGNTLNRLFDGEDMLRELANLLVREVADYCVTYLLDGDRIRRIGAAHADPGRCAEVRRLVALDPPRLQDAIGVGAVIRSGEPLYVREILPSMIAGAGFAPEHFETLEALAPRSTIVLPLRARGRTIGAVTLARTEHSKRLYSESDLVLGREIADRAALSLDNARLFGEARQELRGREVADDGLKRRFRQLHALYDLTHAAQRAVAAEELYEVALDGVREGLAVERASILLLDANGVMRFVAWRGISDDYRGAVEGHSPWPAEIIDPEPVLVPDITADPAIDPELRAVVLEEGIRGLAFIPVAVGGQLLGKFMLYFPQPYVPSEDEIELARTMAGTIGFAIRRIDSERQLREARDEVERANAAKSQFLGMMSHELRTPLNAVLGYTELLILETRGPVNPEQRQQLERIRVSAWHQLELVEELLTYTRLEAGREEPRLMTTDARRVIDDVAELVRPQIDAKRLRLRVESPDGPLTVMTDPARFRQIALNLAGNAAKYTDTGEIELRVSIDGVWLLLVVRDTGPGIPEDRLADIFDPFTRIVEGPAPATTGTGLGLAIARRFADMLGGRIEVTSRMGEGSSFVLRLPVAGPAVA